MTDDDKTQPVVVPEWKIDRKVHYLNPCRGHDWYVECRLYTESTQWVADGDALTTTTANVTCDACRRSLDAWPRRTGSS